MDLPMGTNIDMDRLVSDERNISFLYAGPDKVNFSQNSDFSLNMKVPKSTFGHGCYIFMTAVCL
jgi:hypothetical protein